MPGGDLHLTLVRHGATAWNEQGRWQGVTDNPLAERGKAEAALLARRLRAQAFDRAESSDLQRAVETATHALPGHALAGHTLNLDPRLREMNFGAFEGLTLAEMQAHPAFAHWQADPWHHAPPGGESLADVAARMQDWAGELDGGRVIAFSHSVAIRALLAGLFRWPPVPQPGYPLPLPVRLGHTGLSVLKRRAGHWTLRALGDAAHLEEG